MHQQVQVEPVSELVAARKARRADQAAIKAAAKAKAKAKGNASNFGISNCHLGGFTRGSALIPVTPPALGYVAPTAAAAPPKVVEFFPPVMNIPTWEVDIAKPENMYMITHLGKICEANKLTIVDLQKNLTYPVVYFAANVYAELQYLFKHIPSEWAVILMYRRIGKGNKKVPPHFLIYGYFFVDQEVTGAEVELDQPDFTRYIEYLQATYPAEFGEDIHNKLGHLHSHNGMGAFWSGVDKKQQDSPGQMAFHGDYRIFCVGNNKGDLLVNYCLYANNYLPFEDVATGLYFGEGYTTKLSKERKAELEVQIKALVKKKTYGYVPPAGAAAGGFSKVSDFAQRFDEQEDEFLGGFYGGGYSRSAYEGDKTQRSMNSVKTDSMQTRSDKASSKKLWKALLEIPGSTVTAATDVVVCSGVASTDILGFIFQDNDQSFLGGDGIRVCPFIREEVAEKIIDQIQAQMEDPDLTPLALDTTPDTLITQALEDVEDMFYGTLLCELTDYFLTEVKGLLHGTEYTFPDRTEDFNEQVDEMLVDYFDLNDRENDAFADALWEYIQVFYVHKTEQERLECVVNLKESLRELLGNLIYGTEPGKDSTVKLVDVFMYLRVCTGEKTLNAATTRFQFNNVMLACGSSIHSLHTFESYLKASN